MKNTAASFYCFLVLFHFTKKIKILSNKKCLFFSVKYRFNSMGFVTRCCFDFKLFVFLTKNPFDDNFLHSSFFLKKKVKENQRISKTKQMSQKNLRFGFFLVNVFKKFKYCKSLFLITLKEVCKCFFYFNLYLKKYLLDLLKKLIFFLIPK